MLDRRKPGPCGWPAATMFSQPELERLLDRTAKRLPTVTVHQGWEVSELADAGDHVELHVRSGHADGGAWVASGDEARISAKYAIGCDGAGSIVRETMRTGVHDLGFAFDWLIADTVPHDPALLAGVNLQLCDPARPTTMVSGGPGRRRWEWMLLPGETHEQVEREEFVWALLAKSGVGPRDVKLERHTVYTFRARWAERWREGRMLLAGDAAHLMPPFAGQGMCSGVRDACTLAWHLDLVLRRRAVEPTLDAYTSERLGHLQHAIAMSVGLGKVICITDEREAAARDDAMLSVSANGGAPAIEPPAPALGPGIRDADEPDDGAPTAAGTLFPQGRVSIAGLARLLEDVLDDGFALYLLGADPHSALDVDTRAYLDSLAAQAVEITREMDIDGTYRRWFDKYACVGALVRPDFYVFGTARTAADVSELVARLRAALSDYPSTPQESSA
jgi:2-polyprenyl-6-methoxyphenol hydroxylase-like FAD-dependent oxidoreductase